MPEWERVPLGEVLTRSRETVAVDPQQTYKQVTVRMKHKGVVLREEKSGATIGTTRQFLARPGQFIISSIDARNGANGLIPESLDGAIVTNDFWLFDVDHTRLEQDWLDLYSSTPDFVEACIAASEGTTNRVRLKEDRFLSLEIPLPPLPEQQRIVARVKGLLDKVEEARRLREAQALHISLYNDASFAQLLEPQADWNQTTVDEVIESVDAGWSPQCESQPAKADEWGILRTTAVQWREFRSHENKRLPLGLSGRPELAVLQGDVLVTRAGPRKRVGVVCIVPESALQLMISDKLIRLRPKVDLILPDFLALSLSSPYSQEYLVQRKTGLADAQVNISQKILLNTPLAFPDLARQRNILEVWQQRQQREGELASTLQKSSDELQALPSAILAQAFAGAL